MEKGIYPESTSKADIAKEDSKLCSSGYCFAERWLSSQSGSMARIVGIDADTKNVMPFMVWHAS